jgi:aldose 1-epimerase
VLPSGEQIELQADGYRAVVTEVGATLRRLEYQGRPLVRGYAEDEIMPVYGGAVLAPWPNRIGDGRYRYGGREYQVAINEPERAVALHGLVAWMPWQPISRSSAEVLLEYTLWPTPGYPFRLRLEMAYLLSSIGLTMRLSAENTGADVAPYGCSIHPYLVAGTGRVDEWSLELPAARYLEVDPDRLLPVDERPVEDTPFDFRTPRPLGPVEIDHAFGGVGFDQAGQAQATLLNSDGQGVRLTWDQACPWVQVHTADRPERVLHRTGLAVEPMTCPPDAFRSGTDLVHLAPEQTHTASWQFAAV